MRVASLFSGAGGLDLGLERAGHEILMQCEYDAWRRRLLAQNFPGIPLHADVTSLGEEWLTEQGLALHGGSVDMVAGGFPCTDLSVAGLRKGLAGARSGLFFDGLRVADLLLGDGGWLLLENVPGLFSSNDGRDFAIVLASLAQLGFHDLAWRVLDSRYVRVSSRPAVAQRRRRVFILARRARGRRAAEVLLEPESGGGDFETGRGERPRVAATLSRGSSRPGVSAPGRRQEDDVNVVVNALDRQSGGPDDNAAQAGHIVAPDDLRHSAPEVSPAVTSKWRKGSGGPAGDECQNLVAHTLTSGGFDASEDGTGRGTPLVTTPTYADRDGEPPSVSEGLERAEGDVAEEGVVAFNWQSGQDQLQVDEEVTGTLSKTATPAVSAFVQNQRDEVRLQGGAGDHVGALAASPGVKQQPYILGAVDGADRCAVDPFPDGPRYAAMGDAVSVTVSEWIGRRVVQYGGKPDS